MQRLWDKHPFTVSLVEIGKPAKNPVSYDSKTGAKLKDQITFALGIVHAQATEYTQRLAAKHLSEKQLKT